VRSFAEWGQGFTENDGDLEEPLRRKREEGDFRHVDCPAALRGFFNF
jgi:hypothetical protein